LRYIGNREKPEKELYDPLERYIEQCNVRSQADFAISGDLSVFASIPNPMFSDFEKSVDSPLFFPSRQQGKSLLFSSFMSAPAFWMNGPFAEEKPKPRPEEVDFEVNMMEALVGWKSWEINGQTGILTSNHDCKWKPDVATEAKCNVRCKKIPAEHHTCGIYGAESRYTARDYGEVLGLVYGWGRYIRHDSGWKAQFAYPKCFYLKQEQMNLLELLKQYHVPIYVSQPVKMYDPSEEGYDGYWTEEENGNRGAFEVSPAFEEGDPGEDDED